MERELPGTVVVADMEAGLEHLSWAGGTLRHVDILLVVVEPHAKSVQTALRTHRLALDLGIPRVAFLANRTADGDGERLQAFAAERGAELIGALPEDEAIRRADRLGVCPLDLAPDSVGVLAVAALATELEARFGLEPTGAGAP